MATELQVSGHRKMGIFSTWFLALGSPHSFLENRKYSIQHLTPRYISAASYVPGSVPSTVNTAMDRTMDPALLELTVNTHPSLCNSIVTSALKEQHGVSGGWT